MQGRILVGTIIGVIVALALVAPAMAQTGNFYGTPGNRTPYAQCLWDLASKKPQLWKRDVQSECGHLRTSQDKCYFATEFHCNG